MSAPDRRMLLRYAAGALLLPLASAMAPSGAAATTGRIAPPLGPMRYTRQLERGLPGGASIVVSRSFAVTFTRQAAGFRIDGRQIAVDVRAPDRLAEFASLERQREEPRLFPLLLDAEGLIVGLDGPPGTLRLDAAVREATARLDRRAYTAPQRAELQQFVDAVHRSSGELVAVLPRDLFAPRNDARSESRNIVLPGGDAGAVTVTFSAERDRTTGLMREARREVVSALAGERRQIVESWSLKPLA